MKPSYSGNPVNPSSISVLDALDRIMRQNFPDIVLQPQSSHAPAANGGSVSHPPAANGGSVSHPPPANGGSVSHPPPANGGSVSHPPPGTYLHVSNIPIDISEEELKERMRIFPGCNVDNLKRRPMMGKKNLQEIIVCFVDDSSAKACASAFNGRPFVDSRPECGHVDVKVKTI